jgi:hypothetical protein
MKTKTINTIKSFKWTEDQLKDLKELKTKKEILDYMNNILVDKLNFCIKFNTITVLELKEIIASLKVASTKETKKETKTITLTDLEKKEIDLICNNEITISLTELENFKKYLDLIYTIDKNNRSQKFKAFSDYINNKKIDDTIKDNMKKGLNLAYDYKQNNIILNKDRLTITTIKKVINIFNLIDNKNLSDLENFYNLEYKTYLDYMEKQKKDNKTFKSFKEKLLSKLRNDLKELDKKFSDDLEYNRQIKKICDDFNKFKTVKKDDKIAVSFEASKNDKIEMIEKIESMSDRQIKEMLQIIIDDLQLTNNDLKLWD